MTRQLVAALIGVAVLFSMLSLAIGMWSSRRVMRPVTDLAERLAGAGDQAPPPRLAPLFAEDEVGQLAAALDEYAERLHHLVERDLEFNADVSHELRTPLAVISGATELMLAQRDLPDKARTRLLRIARAARQSTDITTALLHLVRAERGIAEDSNAHDVREVAEQILHLYTPLLENKEVDLRIEELERVSVIAPESVIAVALGNLVSNAVRYTSEGEIVIAIGHGCVRVLDTGPGIAEDELAHVFERHYRGEGATGKGSGLGLAIVKRLCELYGWTIHVSNRERGGLQAELRFYGD